MKRSTGIIYPHIYSFSISLPSWCYIIPRNDESMNGQCYVVYLRNLQLLLSKWQRQRNTLQWRNNERDDISIHQPRDCLLKRLFRCRSKKTSKFHVTGPLCGEFTGFHLIVTSWERPIQLNLYDRFPFSRKRGVDKYIHLPITQLKL